MARQNDAKIMAWSYCCLEFFFFEATREDKYTS